MNISHEEIKKELIALTTQFLIESDQPYKRPVTLESSLQRHLGIDSLARAELFHRVETTFSVILPDQLLAQAETLQDIYDYLISASPTVIKPTTNRIIHIHNERSSVDPLKAHTLIDLLLAYGTQSPSKPHIYFQTEDGKEDVITYGELLKYSLYVANSLRQLGIKDGETVAIMQPTNPGFFYSFFGTLLAGGIPVPIYPPFRMHMLEAYAKVEAKILRNAEVRVLITFEQAEKLSLLLRSFVPSLKNVVTVDELLRPHELNDVFKANKDNFAFIQYTSGSTSDPKGVLLSHHNLLSNIRAYGKGIAVTPDDIAVSWLPLYHDMGLIGMWLGSLYFGVPLILLTPFSFLSHPERWLWAIHYHRGTLSGAPNFAYELCVRKIDPGRLEGLDLSSWRMAANGAEKVYPNTLEQFAKKFAPYGFKKRALLPVYGLAESTVGLAIPPLDRDFRVDHVDRKAFEEDKKANPSNDSSALQFVACGHPIENHEVRIVDAKDNILSERNVGRLQFRGPSSMQGYYNNPKATQAIYHDGWLDSGDLAYVADGEIFITGRSKDLIIKAGRNIYPAEIEELVGNVPHVRQGCVTAFAVSEEKTGTDELIVVAETREKDKLKREHIAKMITETLSTNLDLVPDGVVLVDPHIVPKTSSGKLQRAACKKLYLEQKLEKVHAPTWYQIVRLSLQSGIRRFGLNLIKVGKLFYTIYAILMFVITLAPVFLMSLMSTRESAARFCRIWARAYMRLIFCPVKINGAENIKKTQPVIYAANHASYIDSIVALSLVPANTRLVGKKELLSVPVIGTFMRKLDFLAVDRLDLPKGLMDTKRIENVLKEGGSILIFPEGTFGYSSGLRPFRLGAFKMAVETQVPICPVAFQGTRQILRDDERLMRPGKVTVTVCDVILPTGDEWQDVTKLRQLVRGEIAKYCGEPSLDFIAAEVVAPKIPH